jgi:hypothetical protein
LRGLAGGEVRRGDGAEVDPAERRTGHRTSVDQEDGVRRPAARDRAGAESG